MASIGELMVKIGADASSFTSGMTRVDQSLKVAKAEFDLASAKIGDFGSASDKLNVKADYLNKQIDLQKGKVTALKDAYEKASNSTDVDANSLAKLQVKMLQAEKQLASMESELEKTNKALKDQPTLWNKITDSVKTAGEKLGNIGKTLTTSVTLPLGTLGIASIKLASDLNESLNKVDVAFKNDAKTIEDWSTTTLKSYGIAQGSALDMSATYGDMATSMGLSTGQAAEMSMKMVGLAGDLASFKNISIDVANTALTSVFTGETESLKQLGIVMTQANLQEYAYSQGIRTKIQDMTQAEQVQLRYNYVLAMTTNAQGDFARTGAGTANQTRMFTESLKQLGATLGQNILPVITPVIAKMNELAQSFAGLDSSTQKMVVGGGAIAAALGPVAVVLSKVISVGSTVGSVLAPIGTAVATFGSSIAEAFALVAGGAATVGEGIGLVVAEVNPIGLVITAVVALIAAGVALYKNWDDVKTFLIGAWEKIREGVNTVWGVIVKYFEDLPAKIVGFFNDLPGKLGFAIGLALGALAKFGVDAIKWAILEVPKIIDKIVEFFQGLPDKIQTWLTNAFTNIYNWGVNIITWARTEVPKIITNIATFFAELPGKMLEIGVNVVKGLWEGIQSASAWLQDKIDDFINGIKAGFNVGFEINSPSKVFARIGGSVTEGLALGISDGRSDVDSALSGIMGSMKINASLADGPDITASLSGTGKAGGKATVTANFYGISNAREQWEALQPYIERSLVLSGVG